MNENNEERLVPIMLTYKNKTFSVEIDMSTYEIIMNDPVIRNQYAEQVYNNFFPKNDENQPGPSSLCLGPGKTELIWNDNLIKCLLNVRLQREPEFIKPTCKKAKLWRDIAAEINKNMKINLSGEACDIKYRNLLATYRKNKLKRSSTGETPVKWEYFNIMDETLGCKASSCPPQTNLLDTLNILNQENEDENVEEHTVTNALETKRKREKEGNEIEKCKKKKSGISFQYYLAEKLKRDDKREELQRKQELEKAQQSRERWEEKKALKEREIEAIITLAHAIKKNP